MRATRQEPWYEEMYEIMCVGFAPIAIGFIVWFSWGDITGAWDYITALLPSVCG